MPGNVKEIPWYESLSVFITLLLRLRKQLQLRGEGLSHKRIYICNVDLSKILVAPKPMQAFQQSEWNYCSDFSLLCEYSPSSPLAVALVSLPPSYTMCYLHILPGTLAWLQPIRDHIKVLHTLYCSQVYLGIYFYVIDSKSASELETWYPMDIIHEQFFLGRLYPHTIYELLYPGTDEQWLYPGIHVSWYSLTYEHPIWWMG